MYRQAGHASDTCHSPQRACSVADRLGRFLGEIAGLLELPGMSVDVK